MTAWIAAARSAITGCTSNGEKTISRARQRNRRRGATLTPNRQRTAYARKTTGCLVAGTPRLSPHREGSARRAGQLRQEGREISTSTTVTTVERFDSFYGQTPILPSGTFTTTRR